MGHVPSGRLHQDGKVLRRDRLRHVHRPPTAVPAARETFLPAPGDPVGHGIRVGQPPGPVPRDASAARRARQQVQSRQGQPQEVFHVLDGARLDPAVYTVTLLCCSPVLGIWVWLTALPTLILNSKSEDTAIGRRDYIGWCLWLVGMLIEATADYQKYTFRSKPANRLDQFRPLYHNTVYYVNI